MPRKQSPALPTRQQVLDFIATSDVPAGKREIARARRVIFKRAERGEPALWHYLSRFSGGGDV